MLVEKFFIVIVIGLHILSSLLFVCMHIKDVYRDTIHSYCYWFTHFAFSFLRLHAMYWCNTLFDMYENRLQGINFFYVGFLDIQSIFIFHKLSSIYVTRHWWSFYEICTLLMFFCEMQTQGSVEHAPLRFYFF